MQICDVFNLPAIFLKMYIFHVTAFFLVKYLSNELSALIGSSNL